MNWLRSVSLVMSFFSNTDYLAVSLAEGMEGNENGMFLFYCNSNGKITLVA